MNRYFNEALGIKFLSITLVILLLLILYRVLLRFLSRKHVKTEDYCTLYTVEDQPVTGVIPFYFSSNQARNVLLFLETGSGELVATLKDELFEAGGHLVRYDCTQLTDGVYFYVMKTENQEIRKKLLIQH